MELCGATSISWANSITPSHHFTQRLAVWRVRQTRVLSVTSSIAKEDEMIVSVTGATGFIGKRLVQRLLADDHRVRVLTRSRSNALSVFPGKKVMKL